MQRCRGLGGVLHRASVACFSGAAGQSSGGDQARDLGRPRAGRPRSWRALGSS